MKRRSAFLLVGVLLLLAGASGWIVGSGSWGHSWIGIVGGALLVILGLSADDS